MTYAMTIKSNSTNHLWRRCRATTLHGAKCAATLLLGASMYSGDLLAVAEMHRSKRTEPEYRDAVQYRTMAVWNSLTGWSNIVS